MLTVIVADMFDAQDIPDDDDELISIPDDQVAVPQGTMRSRPKPKSKRKGKRKGQLEEDASEPSTAMEVDAANDQEMGDQSTGKGEAKASSSNNGKGRGKGNSKEIIISDEEDDSFDVPQLDPVGELTGRNKPGSKKTRIRSPQAGSKRRPSVGSPTSTSPSKGRKRTRKGTIGDQQGSTVKDRMKGKVRLAQAEVEASDSSANFTLALATAQLRMQDTSVPQTPDFTMSDLIHSDPIDPINAALNAPGGQNDPDQDEELAMRGLRTPEPADNHPPTNAMSSSPLTDLASQADEMQLDEVAYMIPHRAVAGPSRLPIEAPPPPPPIPLMGGLHRGSLAKNRDGSGNAKPKLRPKYRPCKPRRSA